MSKENVLKIFKGLNIQRQPKPLSKAFEALNDLGYDVTPKVVGDRIWMGFKKESCWEHDKIDVKKANNIWEILAGYFFNLYEHQTDPNKFLLTIGRVGNTKNWIISK